MCAYILYLVRKVEAEDHFTHSATKFRPLSALKIVLVLNNEAENIMNEIICLNCLFVLLVKILTYVKKLMSF